MHDLAQTPEAVAYQLMQDILATEGAANGPHSREALLQIYGECLRVVRPDPLRANPTHGRSSF